jgi:hypothetical protein
VKDAKYFDSGGADSVNDEVRQARNNDFAGSRHRAQPPRLWELGQSKYGKPNLSTNLSCGVWVAVRNVRDLIAKGF